MFDMRGLTTFAVGAVLAAANAADAQFFIVGGSGTYEITTPGPSSTSTAVLALDVVAGPFDFATASGTLETDSTVTPAIVVGEVTLLNVSGHELVISLSGNAFGVGEAYQTGAGDWTMLSGTGAFVGLVGSGTWSYGIDFSAGFTGPQPMTATMGGTLIPSPGSLALTSLAVGTIFMRRRR